MPLCWALGLQKERQIQPGAAARYVKLPQHKDTAGGGEVRLPREERLFGRGRDGVHVRYGLLVVGPVCAKAMWGFIPKRFLGLKQKLVGAGAGGGEQSEWLQNRERQKGSRSVAELALVLLVVGTGEEN